MDAVRLAWLLEVTWLTDGYQLSFHGGKGDQRSLA